MGILAIANCYRGALKILKNGVLFQLLDVLRSRKRSRTRTATTGGQQEDGYRTGIEKEKSHSRTRSNGVARGSRRDREEAQALPNSEMDKSKLTPPIR